MLNDVRLQDSSELSYLNASKVESPGGVLAGLDVLTSDGKRLGSIEGVVIDAAARRVRYFEVRSSGLFGRKRYLVEADQFAQLEPERHAIRLRLNIREGAVHGLDTTALREFSDEDILDAMFAPRVA
jgi:hypothetical protein